LFCNKDPNRGPTSASQSSNTSSSNNNKSQADNQQMLQLIKEAFRNCSQNGVVTKDKFNQALSILEALGFKRLRDTPLADRLFYIFDKVQINLSRTTQVKLPKHNSLRVLARLSVINKMPSIVKIGII
jgi:hypothetical protein